mmetsp:Transcript_2560/g.3946  ORF Transcript_2560/g.3946 Transcript_2560/m.3946 type:complete len:158 (-) Transcript_2560:1452-1925(-)
MAADRKALSKVQVNVSSPSKTDKKLPEYESLETDLGGEGFGFQREKSKNLLLGSQIETMQEVFGRLDHYKEGLLQRSKLVLALRSELRVIDFINCEAVKKAYSNSTLTLDQVLMEIEKDERYDQAENNNHKMYINWREFLDYFDDYQEIEVRNKKQQ